MTLLNPDRDSCDACPSNIEQAGFRVVEEKTATRRFLCQEHLFAALRELLIPSRIIVREE